MLVLFAINGATIPNAVFLRLVARPPQEVYLELLEVETSGNQSSAGRDGALHPYLAVCVVSIKVECPSPKLIFAYRILELDKRVDRKVHTHAVDVAAPDF